MACHLRLPGQIPVDPENPRGSIRSLTRAVAPIRDNMPLVVFPEGGRSEDGRLQPFMGGAFFAAIKAQVEVVPMAIVGTYEILKMNTWHIKPRPVRLILGEPIATPGFNVPDTEYVSNTSPETLASLYGNSSVP